MMNFDFETVAEQQERVKQEKERKDIDDVTVNVTLVKPHSQCIYNTEKLFD